MALVASPPPASASLMGDTSMSDSLDDEITQVRAEIQSLTQRRKLLSSSLLASTTVQSRLANLQATNAPLHQDLSPALESSRQTAEANTYRLAFGITAFPFHDPSPELQPKNPLLGIRIDICDRSGRFDSPYYVFCMRATERDGQEGQEEAPELRIHRHTIPALVPLEQYEREYLPRSQPDEGYGGSEDSVLSNDAGRSRKQQDLHGLIARVRHDLVAWRLRRDAIDLLREDLGLADAGSQPVETREDDGKTSDENHGLDNEGDDDEAERDNGLDEDRVGRFSIREIAPQGVDARQLRIIWSDDRLARIRFADDGRVDKARVFGPDMNRMGHVESILSQGNPMIYDLMERLERAHARAPAGDPGDPGLAAAGPQDDGIGRAGGARRARKS